MSRTTHIAEEAVRPERPLWRRRTVGLAKLILAIALLAWLFRSGRLDLSGMRSIRHAGYLFAALAALVASMLLQAFRWLLLLVQQRLEVSRTLAIKLFWLGRFATLFLPGAAGGDLARAYAVCRILPHAKTRALSTIFMDRVFGLHSLLFIGSAVGFLAYSKHPTSPQVPVITFVILCFLGGTAGLLLLLDGRTSGLVVRILPGRFRESFKSSLNLYQNSPIELLRIWLFSGLCNVFAIAPYCLVAAALGIEVSFDQILAIPLIIVALSLPVTPGGLGIGEAVGSGLYATFGVSHGALIVLIVRLFIAIISLPGAWVFLSLSYGIRSRGGKFLG